MYSYHTEKPELFTEAGQVMFLRVRDAARAHLKLSGAVQCHVLMSAAGGGSSWTMLACVDRLEELKEIRRVDDGKCSTQDQVYVRGTLPL